MQISISDPTNALKRAPARFAAVLFLILAPVHILLSQEQSLVVAGVTLALIGGAYIGFAARADSKRVFWMEFPTAVFFALIAVAGILVHWAFLPLGLALHAGWDLLHHNRAFGAAVPRWYIPFCVTFDLAAAAFLFLLYGAKALGS